MASTPLQHVLAAWRDAWPKALACWSRFVQLTEPRWCLDEQDEKREHLTGSFAMIRLIDHAVVISLRQIRDERLEEFALEILAHEIGHHVYCPADLTDNARCLARIRAGLPTREKNAPFIANLYTDLLINDRLQRSSSLNIAGVYRRLAIPQQGRLWTLYMRIYEMLWKLERGELARGTIDARLDSDAALGARLIRSYARDWVEGAGRFAVLCLPYLLEDAQKQLESLRISWHDTLCAGQGASPDGLSEIEEGEADGAIHPAEDEALTGIKGTGGKGDGDGDGDGEDGTGVTTGAGPGRAAAGNLGRKSMKTYRGPWEYIDVVKATGTDLTERQITARYYRERALPHLVRFPVRQSPQAVDPLPEALEVWDVGSPIDDIDWLGSVVASPQVIPGITTRQRLFGASPGTSVDATPVDLYLGVDCSGSMSDPAHHLSFPVLAGAIIALSALRAGSKVMVALSGEPGKTVTTDGFVRDEKSVLGTLTDYLGTGTSFGIHRLDEVFRDWSPHRRPVHILIVSDSDIFSSLAGQSGNRLGWDVAREAVAKARGGGTYVLQLPSHVRTSAQGKAFVDPNRVRMEADGWQVSPVNSMEELIDFARRFSKASYAKNGRGG